MLAVEHAYAPRTICAFPHRSLMQQIRRMAQLLHVWQPHRNVARLGYVPNPGERRVLELVNHDISHCPMKLRKPLGSLDQNGRLHRAATDA